MHPILFRIPLPNMKVPYLWLFLAAAGIALAYAIFQLATRNKQAAYTAGGVAVIAAIAGFFMKDGAWDAGPIPIYSYGVMLGLSLVVGWYLTLGLAERDGLPKETMANNYVITAIAAVVGSRILYILTNLNEFDSFGSMFAMRRGGLVAYGGFLGGFVGSLVYLRMHKIPLLPWADVAVPSLASGLAITRIGCYLFGCDFGQPLADNAPSWLKKLGSFPHWPAGTLETGEGAPAWVQHVRERGLDRDATHSLPVHPTQIYESLVGVALLLLLLTARKRQKFRGQIFLLFTFSYGVCRFLLEVLRDDAERGSLPPALPEHILYPLGLLLLAVGYFIGFSKMIENPTVQRATQVIAFIPPVLLYIALKPESFATGTIAQFSTSQAVAITTGFAASLAFAAYYKAALAHPESAMALNLPSEAGTSDEEQSDEAAEDGEEDDEAEDERPKAKKSVKKSSVKKKKAKAKKAAEPPPEEEADDEASEDTEGESEEADTSKDEDAESAKDEPENKKRSEAEESPPPRKAKRDKSEEEQS